MVMKKARLSCGEGRRRWLGFGSWSEMRLRQGRRKFGGEGGRLRGGSPALDGEEEVVLRQPGGAVCEPGHGGSDCEFGEEKIRVNN